MATQSQLLSLMTPAQIHVEGLEKAGGKTLRVFLLAASDPSAVPPSRLEFPPGSIQAGALTLPVAPDRYLMALDTGPTVPPAVFEGIDAASSSNPSVRYAAGDGKSLRLRILDALTKSPLAGASLTLRGQISDRERLLLAALVERSGKSDAQGVLDVGALPAGPLRLWVAADGRRTAQVPAERGSARGPVDVALAAYQDLEIVWAEGAKLGEGRQPDTILSACRQQLSGKACGDSAKKAQQRLGANGKTRFARCAPGLYRVMLTFDGRSGSSSLAEASDDSADPAVASMAVSLREWHLRGRAKLRDGSPVKARVQANTIVVDPRQGQGDTLFDTSSAGDGSFFAAFFAPEGVRLSIDAFAEKPAAETLGVQAQILNSSLEQEEIELTLISGGVRVLVRDRRDDKPIESCSVAVWFENGVASRQVTDADGAAQFIGGEAGAVRISAQCEGYSSSAETLAEFSDNEMRDVAIRLDRAGAIEVVVLDSGGRPVAGAQLLVLDMTRISRDQLGYGLEPTSVGVTGGDGRLTLRGDLYGGRPVFVIAPSSALTIGWLPTAIAAGSSTSSSTVEYRPEPPSAFPGLAVSDASGHALRVEWLAFSKNGIPIPRKILELLAQANGLSPSGLIVGPATQPMVVMPSYFASGEYSVAYVIADKETHRPRAIQLGAIRLPSSVRIELRAMLAP